jgi:DNA-nicking Smr family endonuclease
MRIRRLSAEEHALWARVARTARPLPGKASPDADAVPDISFAEAMVADAARPVRGRTAPAPSRAPMPKAPAMRDTLDGSWDKRITKGDVQPDVTIDLHGETLATAHARLNRGLDSAIRRGDRTILLITGRPAVDNPRLPPTSRGVIRASVIDWLAVSPHADRIAAIRNAHPRHGGAGALYIILRRAR